MINVEHTDSFVAYKHSAVDKVPRLVDKLSDLWIASGDNVVSRWFTESTLTLGFRHIAPASDLCMNLWKLALTGDRGCPRVTGANRGWRRS